MTLRRPLSLIAGIFREMPTGDAVPITAGGTGGATVDQAATNLGIKRTTFAASPPTDPVPVAGDKWIDTSDPGVLVEYTWIADADSGQWVELGSGGLSPDVAALTHASTITTSPANADEIPVLDSGTGFTLKRLTWSALKAALFSGGVAIGEQAPTLKLKVVTVVAPSAGPAVNSVPHGLERSKIRMIVATVNGTTYAVGPDYATNQALNFAATTTNADCTVYVTAGAADVVGRPVYFTILYVP